MEQLTVDHLDHNKRNNSVDNLEWVTRAENMRRARANNGFRAALLATGNSVLTYSIGKTKITETVLTRQEFCSRLMKTREQLRKDEIKWHIVDM